jgi:hypothetical protein
MKTNLKKAFFTMLATLGLGMLVLGSATTWAADMCFLDDYNSTLVAKNFSFPAAGACRSFDGYELGTSCIISGTACGTSDNGVIAFHLDTSCPFVNYQGVSSFRISRVNSNLNQAGYGYAVQTNTGYMTTWHIKTVPCPSPHPLY